MTTRCVDVRRLTGAMLANLACLLLCLLGPNAAMAAKIELADLLDRDPLGYQCIPSQYFDEQPDGSAALAFTVGKKSRLPRTCMPDPCARALTRNELSQITGTEPMLARFSEEWEDYYARYADHCVREVTVSRPRADSNFWTPILAEARNTQRVGLPTSSRFRPFVQDDVTGDIPTLILAQTPQFVAYGPRIGPSPIPVPASGLLLASVIGAACFGRRLARRKTTT